MLVLYSIIIIFTGMCIFSFLNVVIYRLPLGISFARGRSFCPRCKTQLKGYDMVPVLSWLLLGGKCRTCKSPISPRYPLVEALGGLAAWLALRFFGEWNGYYYALTPQSVLSFALLSLLTVIAFIDIDTMEIPNSLQVVGIVIALASVFAFPEVKLSARIIGLFSVSVFMLALAIAVPGAFGGGDIKLMAVMGFYLGWKYILTAFFIAILTGGMWGIYLLAVKKKKGKDQFAFGPFLCIGIAVTIFCGEPLLEWYLKFLL